MASDAPLDSTAHRPTPAEAAAALRQVRDAQSSLGRRLAPSWYFAAVAAMLGATTLSQLLPTAATIVVTLALVAIMGAVVRVFFDRAGVVPQVGKVNARWIILATTPLVLVTLAAAWLDDSGREWGWIVAAIVNSGTVLGVGWWHRRQLRAGA
ncbi:hypothetical protein AB0J90_14840 [Micromonospora sp. NPDC049523]|uniref:hypothetical protein n=1 Tax=Micromonospora sp. NPDC049523 TaxID=3155921 RepID=UPI00342CF95B